ncbi:serine/threonine protein phosphatase [Herbaspirillum sp. HC18]|nr:serine/threonine protein phosphatase [Herbaspirillum sp. HC18]
MNRGDDMAAGLHWTPCRSRVGAAHPRGSTPPGTAIYVVGDIHGRYDLLERLQRGIAADAAMRRAPRKLIVYLGDYLSRGKDSHRVVSSVSTWRPDTCGTVEIVTLKGNHEDLALCFLQGDMKAGREWFDHGGLHALAAYGIDAGIEDMHDDKSMELLRRRFAAALPERDLVFLSNLKASHREGDYYFVHAGVFPGVPLAAQSARDQIWIRGRFLESEADHGAIVVHGHSIMALPDIRHNRIGIDTGAYDSGVLTCLVLDGEEQALLQTCPCMAEHAACTISREQA